MSRSRHWLTLHRHGCNVHVRIAWSSKVPLEVKANPSKSGTVEVQQCFTDRGHCAHYITISTVSTPHVTHADQINLTTLHYEWHNFISPHHFGKQRLLHCCCRTNKRNICSFCRSKSFFSTWTSQLLHSSFRVNKTSNSTIFSVLHKKMKSSMFFFFIP